MNTSKALMQLMFAFFLLLSFKAHSQFGSSVTLVDDTYGEGGKRTISSKLKGEHITMGDVIDTLREIKIFDPNGTLRYHKIVITNDYFPGRDSAVTEIYYDCFATRQYDVYKVWVHNKEKKPVLQRMEEQIYEEGEVKRGLDRRFRVESGFEVVDVKYFKDGKWEADYQKTNFNFEDSTFPNGDYHQDKTPCPKNIIHSELIVYGSGIVEDSKPSFLTYGGGIDYRRLLNKSFGLAIDASVNFGSNAGVDYTKFGIMAGPSFLPVKSADGNDPFRFYVDVLGGVTSLHSKVGSFSSTSTNFSMEIGATGSFVHRNKPGFSFLVDYNPVFFPGNTANNFRFGAGINFGHGSKKR